MNDKILQQTVEDALEWDPSIDSAHIGVTASDGVVTLTGKVGNYAAKSAAERVVGSTRGVKAIAEELQVEYPFGTREDDSEIAKRAVQMFSWNIDVPPGRVKVKVEKGWATISGELDWNYQREAAESVVRNLHGVTGVINEIRIKPRVATADLHYKIGAALTRNARIEADGISVTADGGKVTLSGTVPRFADRRLVEQTAWSAPGVTEVEDRLTVA